jgi:hypothetical protein
VNTLNPATNNLNEIIWFDWNRNVEFNHANEWIASKPSFTNITALVITLLGNNLLKSLLLICLFLLLIAQAINNPAAIARVVGLVHLDAVGVYLVVPLNGKQVFLVNKRTIKNFYQSYR